MAPAQALGDACSRRCGPSTSTDCTCLIDKEIRRSTERASNRSAVAHSWSTGIAIFERSADKSTLSALAMRARNTAGIVVRNASRRALIRVGEAQTPKSNQAKSTSGTARMGTLCVNPSSGESHGIGFIATVVESTSPMRFFRGATAIASAIGPEND